MNNYRIFLPKKLFISLLLTLALVGVNGHATKRPSAQMDDFNPYESCGEELSPPELFPETNTSVADLDGEQPPKKRQRIGSPINNSSITHATPTPCSPATTSATLQPFTSASLLPNVSQSLSSDKPPYALNQVPAASRTPSALGAAVPSSVSTYETDSDEEYDEQDDDVETDEEDNDDQNDPDCYPQPIAASSADVNQQQSVASPFTCTLCRNKLFSTLYSFCKHLLQKHMGICPYYGHGPLTTNSGLIMHIQSKHQGITYQCPDCGKLFTQQANLRAHIKSVHQGITYQCPDCSKLFTQQANLRTHIKSVHQGITYQCPDCGKLFTQQASLQKHRRAKHP